jgi:hypothetical protein
MKFEMAAAFPSHNRSLRAIHEQSWGESITVNACRFERRPSWSAEVKFLMQW